MCLHCYPVLSERTVLLRLVMPILGGCYDLLFLVLSIAFPCFTIQRTFAKTKDTTKTTTMLFLPQWRNPHAAERASAARPKH